MPQRGFPIYATAFCFAPLALTPAGTYAAEVHLACYLTPRRFLYSSRVADIPLALPLGDRPWAPAAPQSYALHPNMPNPFNPETQIRFDLPISGPLRLTVDNASGRQRERLVERGTQPRTTAGFISAN